jgi:hypothetical protein
MGRIKERLSAFAVAVLISAPSHATPVSADAVLSHSDLSIDEPINFSVDFGVTFSSIQTVTIDAYWVNDGFGPSEGIFYRDCDPQSLCPGLGGYDSLDNTLFPVLTIVEQSVFDLFLDGALQGSIVTDTGFPNTTATYGRLVFTVDGSRVSAGTGESPSGMHSAIRTGPDRKKRCAAALFPWCATDAPASLLRREQLGIDPLSLSLSCTMPERFGPLFRAQGYNWGY